MQSAILLLIVAPFVGSFLGLLIERLPRGEPVVTGRSVCRACATPLGPLDLVPLLSWSLGRARCRHCHAALSGFYPAIELVALGVAIWSLLAVPGWLAWSTAALGWTLVALAEIDRRHFILPDILSLPLIGAGLVLAWAIPNMALGQHLIGVLAGAGVISLVAVGYERFRGREGLGLGDVKLFAAAGAWVGWQGLASVLLIGAASGLAVALIARWRAQKPIPFGPFLALGFWLTWLYGPLGY